MRHQSSPPLSFVVLCMYEYCVVRCVARLARASKKKRRIFGNGQMVTMPDFGFDGVSSSLAQFMTFLCFNFFFFSF